MQNTEAVTYKLLRALDVKVNKSVIESSLRQHPEYPSILAISDCLDDYEVENYCYRIDKKQIKVEELVFPFLAHYYDTRFVLVKSISNDRVSYSDEHVEDGVMSFNELLHLWNGITFHATPNEKSGELNYYTNRVNSLIFSLKFPVLIVAFLMVIVSFWLQKGFSLSFAGLLFTKTIGLGTALFLIAQSLNNRNPYVKNICSIVGKNDCNSILKSEAAKITSWLSWSDIGFLYFSSTFLLFLIEPHNIFLAILGYLVLPYTLYSISYQVIKKQWCVLCCLIQAVFLIEGVLFFISKDFSINPNLIEIQNIVNLLLAVMVPIVIWSYLRPTMIDAQQLRSVKRQLNKFKYNYEIFEQNLTSQIRYDISKDLSPISLGDPSSETVVTIISNPFCPPCAEMHMKIDELLKSRALRVDVLFTNFSKQDTQKTRVSRHLSALNMKADDCVHEAMNDWYSSSKKDYEAWALKYPTVLTPEVDEVTQRQSDWCHSVEITATPTVLINGYKLPDLYRVDDLKYLLS